MQFVDEKALFHAMINEGHDPFMFAFDPVCRWRGVACRADVGYRALAYHPPAWWGCDDADGECRPFDLLGLLRDGWPTERGLGGDPDGLPAWLDAAAWEAGVPRVAPSTSTTRPRLAGCGNAVVPQWAYEVGQRVLHHMEHTRHASR